MLSYGPLSSPIGSYASISVGHRGACAILANGVGSCWSFWKNG
jgi:hypothetical protein